MRKAKEIRLALRQTYIHPSANGWHCLKSHIFHSDSYIRYRFLLHLRKYEHLLTKPSSPFSVIARRWNLMQYQKYAGKCGYVIGDGVLGENVIFHHSANIIINRRARVGAGCVFHGNCCIGVAHTGDEKAPVLGQNVDIGYGAVILGDIYIADNITIGANSVVTKSFHTPGITIAGVPAREIKRSVSP